MRNKYAGICYRCGKTVEPFKGHFENPNKKRNGVKSIDQTWLVQHAECAIKYRGTDVHYINNPRKLRE